MKAHRREKAARCRELKGHCLALAVSPGLFIDLNNKAAQPIGRRYGFVTWWSVLALHGVSCQGTEPAGVVVKSANGFECVFIQLMGSLLGTLQAQKDHIGVVVEFGVSTGVLPQMVSVCGVVQTVVS